MKILQESSRIRLARWLLVTGSLAGCNMITGADSIVLERRRGDSTASAGGEATSGETVGPATVGGFDDDGASGTSGSGASGPGSGPGTAVTSASSVSVAVSSSMAATTGGGADDPPPPPPPPPGPPAVTNAADGVAVVDVKLYQAVEVPLTKASDIPIVAGKDALVRVFYQVQSGYDGKPVTARFMAGDGYAESTQVLSGSSTQGVLGSTANIKVPGSLLKVGGTFRVDLVQANGSGTNSAAGYPQGTGQTPHNAKSAGTKLRVVLVPVMNGGSLPDTTPAQVKKYTDFIRWQYPIPEVEVTVRAQHYTYNGSLWGYGGWSDLLQEISDLRDGDNVDPEVYYYGIHNAQSSGLLGLGWVAGSKDVWSRAAIGVGWTGDTAPETAVHELGHNHGRSHSPCGVDGDWNYPHPGAKIGVWGYHPGKDKLLDPSKHVDFMSYCDPPWVSDHTYKALYTRLKSVNGAKVIYPAELMNRTWERVKVLEGVATFVDSITLAYPPSGEAKKVTVTSSNGTEEIEGQYLAYNHLEGGLLYVLRPKFVESDASPLTVAFDVGGKSVAIAR
ncbi:MAG: hypothetical protein FJ096_12875 [Deltaproteobacteria bacterium]|nr:hypothetical protein [Deltaproteobacteria bacterium]